MFEFLEGILTDLKNVPGLAFLKRLHTQLVVKRSRLRNKLQALKNHKDLVQDLSRKTGSLSRSNKGSKSRND